MDLGEHEPPVDLLVGRDLHRQLDHLLGLQFDAGHVDQQVADAGGGRGRQFDHHAGVEAADRPREFFARLALAPIGLVRLVEDHDRAQHLEDVEQAALDRAVAGDALEIGKFVQQPGVGQHVVAVGEQGRIAPGIAEHAQEVPPLLPVGGGQHQQHHAQIVVHVERPEPVVLLQQLDPPAAGALQHLAIGMLPIAQRGFGLLVDGVGGDDPERQAGPGTQPFQRRGGEQRLAAAGRHLEADVRDRPPGVVETVHIGAVAARDAAGLGQTGPGGPRVVAHPVRDAGPGFLQRGDLRPRGPRRVLQRVAPTREGFERARLIFLQLHHGARRLTRPDTVRKAAGRTGCPCSSDGAG